MRVCYSVSMDLCRKCETRKIAHGGLCRRCHNERTDKRSYRRGGLQDRLAHYSKTVGDCRIWTGTTDGHGYGLVWDAKRGRNVYAHVAAWELRWKSSASGRVVRHKCDTPLCVKPSHLRIGTHADNVADKVAKGRQARGEGHGMSKLTVEMVESIRELSTQGVPQAEIAKRFQISQPNVHLVVSGKTWNLPGKI